MQNPKHRIPNPLIPGPRPIVDKFYLWRKLYSAADFDILTYVEMTVTWSIDEAWYCGCEAVLKELRQTGVSYIARTQTHRLDDVLEG